ncbi:DoxX family protein [Saccharothrix algeriensis]|uniref:DoxX family protein n=1 Tax=Saccharothrix algeriensis TaxID=173560 RepID=A0A8T8HZP3_9PSEU|nr:DoxX family protein [Saccharothrix algeriensis]MBM7809373.1 putative membrane protein [Saccharothrix algeriensis]QTR03720.1 DoxX family protein [Saccharothrix algeriensis]
MAPLVILVVVTLTLALGRALGLRRIPPWPFAVRAGLAAMFTATGVAHFVGMREQLVAMVPPALPAPELLVTVTGVLELLGAAGLLWRRTSPWAAAGLSALLIAMFPANVHAAAEGLSPSFGDRLLPRTIMQVVFLAATAGVLVHHLRARREARPLDVTRSAGA